MTATAVSYPDSCGTISGDVVTVVAPGQRADDPVTERNRATWTAGDFEKIAVGFASGAATFVEQLDLRVGERVLDVACGTGNLAIPAAKIGARVTGLDIAPNLLERARRKSAELGLDIAFDEGNAERLPYDDGAFDVVMSMFGVMFAPRPEQALAELLRVTAPGGRIALANWTPGGFIGKMLRAHTRLVPPPAGAVSPLEWGDQSKLQERLGAHVRRTRAVRCVPRTIALEFPLTPGGVVELFREFYGPSVRTFGALDAAGRAALAADMLDLWTIHNAAPNGSTHVDAEYLDVRIAVD